MMINEDGPRKWAVCLRWIKDRIDDGTYPDGKWLPLIDEICSAVNLSTVPVRQALTQLGDMRIITQVPRTGWYVGTGAVPEETSPAEVKRHRRGYRDQKPSPPPVEENKYDWDQGRQEPGEPDPFLTEESYIFPSEFAAMIRVSKMTMYRLIHTKEIEGVIRVGRSLRIPISGARKYLENAKDFDLDDLDELEDDE